MTEETADRYQMLIELACPGYRDQIIFETTDTKTFEPVVDVRDGGIRWEKYTDPDGDWVEVPQHLIVKRECFKVPKPKPVEPPSLFERTAEQRLGGPTTPTRPAGPEPTPRRSVK